MPSVDEEDGLSFPFADGGPRYILAPFVPTPEDVVERMLKLAEVTSRDVVYDLGCGDGRIIITAATKYGARGVGVDIEPYWVAESRSSAQKAGVDHLVTFSLQDAMTVDLSAATVVMLYLVHWSTSKLQPIIKRQVKPGTRVVSHSFTMGDWTPVKTETFTDASGSVRRLYLWIVDDGVRPELS
jgi:cyclopropane fatty-acyl-phospholipid synthase-like methyltransferase